MRWNDVNLHTLLKDLKVKKISGSLPETEVNKITQDTREVEPGDVFVCIDGALFDGHQYASDAAAKGALAIVAEKEIEADLNGVPVVYTTDTRKAMTILAASFYGHPSEELTVIGVTGTNGKTSVTFLIDTILRTLGKRTGLVGTIEMHIGDEVYPTKNTTPDNITMQRSMRKMVEVGVEVCSMEVSSHSLVQGRTWGIDIDVAVLTNLTHEHLDYHKTMENYAHAKELLFSQMGNSWKNGRSKVAVLNKDDATFQQYSQATPAEVISYSLKDEAADFYARNIQYGLEGTDFELVVFGQTYPVHTQLIGTYNVSNALAAIAAVYAIGVPVADAVRAVSRLRGVEGRLQPLPHTKGYGVFIDYAHSPDGLEKVLDALRPITKGRLINVMGCQGSRDQEKRPVMGRIATEHADHVVFTTDSPEMEEQADIIRMVLSGVQKDNYTYVEDRREAIFHAVNIAQPGDNIVITGRGHEKTYNVKRNAIEFLDGAVAQEAIDARNQREG